MLAAILTDFKDALMTGLAGTSRPSQLQAGGMWIDTSDQAAPTYQWIYKLWTGTVDVEVFRININSSYGGSLTASAIFQVQQISADTVGALTELIKQRVASNGQLLSGDTIGEIQFIGRTNTSTDPTVAYIKWTATDNQTSSIFGGTLSFYSTPDASAVITEHLKFIDGLVEVPVPLVINALKLVSQNVATTPTIVQLSASKTVVEFTGATQTEIQGINSAHDSKEVTIHNRSTANVILRHQNGSAAASDRLKLVNALDFVIEPEACTTLYYCTTDERWKLKSSVRLGAAHNSEVLKSPYQEWTAPTGVTRVTLTALNRPARQWQYGFRDRYGNLYATGNNTVGQLGVNDTTRRSSPVAVVGGLNFKKMNVNPQGVLTEHSFAILPNGTAYAWGGLDLGVLGTLNGAGNTSPSVVVGGFRYKKIVASDLAVLALGTNSKAYAWGSQTHGALGNGVSTGSVSSPVVVLGDLNFSDLIINVPSSALGWSSAGLTKSGLVYTWGNNAVGSLGLGDTTSRSSPVVVPGLSGVVKIASVGRSSRYSTFYALTDDGDLYAWGDNTRGQLGDGTTNPSSSPLLVGGGAITFTDFWTYSPGAVVFARADDGTYYAWGDNSSGDLAINDTTARSTPTAVTALSGLNANEIWAANGSYYTLTDSGDIYAWGDNSSGQLGVGDVTARSTPTVVVGGLKFSSISTITNGPRAVSGGLMYAWGNNSSGELGVGDRTARSSPVLQVGSFGVDANDESRVQTVDVVPGQSYVVRLIDGACYFGNTPLGEDVYRLTIDYIERGD